MGKQLNIRSSSRKRRTKKGRREDIVSGENNIRTALPEDWTWALKDRDSRREAEGVSGGRKTVTKIEWRLAWK